MCVKEAGIYSNRGMLQHYVSRSSHCCKQGYGLTAILSLQKPSFFSALLTAKLLLNNNK